MSTPENTQAINGYILQATGSLAAGDFNKFANNLLDIDRLVISQRPLLFSTIISNIAVFAATGEIAKAEQCLNFLTKLNDAQK